MGMFILKCHLLHQYYLSKVLPTLCFQLNSCMPGKQWIMVHVLGSCQPHERPRLVPLTPGFDWAYFLQAFKEWIMDGRLSLSLCHSTFQIYKYPHFLLKTDLTNNSVFYSNNIHAFRTLKEYLLFTYGYWKENVKSNPDVLLYYHITKTSNRHTPIMPQTNLISFLLKNHLEILLSWGITREWSTGPLCNQSCMLKGV